MDYKYTFQVCAYINNSIFFFLIISYLGSRCRACYCDCSSSVIINFLSHCIFIKNKNFNFYFFYLLAVIIFIAYKMNRYSEYGNDAPTHFLFFFLISELIQFIQKKEKQFESNHLLLAIFIILNKITMAFAIFLPFIFLKQKKIFHQIFIPINIFPIFFLFLWLFKNIIISGCVIYPVSKLCFENLEWSKFRSE